MSHSNEKNWQFCNLIRGKVDLRIGETAPAVIAAALVLLEREGAVPESLAADEDVLEMKRHYLQAGYEELDWLPQGMFSPEELKDIIINANDSLDRTSSIKGAPQSIVDLATEMLYINPDNTVACFGCGTGAFMTSVCQEKSVSSFFGIDLNYTSAVVSRIKAAFIETPCEVKLGDAFGAQGKYDRIFCNCPFGVPASVVAGKSLEGNEGLVPDGIRVRSAEWLFALKALSCLARGGRAAIVMSGGPIYNASDKAIRQYLIENQLIECVIALPAGLYAPSTNIETFLVVLGGEEFTRLIDATDLGVRERRVTKLTEADIHEIGLRMMEEPCPTAVSLDPEDFEDYNWSLDPKRCMVSYEPGYGEPLASYATVITRGGNIPAAELDNRLTKKRTPYRYLMIRDIEDGEIRPDLPYLENILPSEERYCLEDGDIVLGKMSPFKVAVARLKPGEKILATGNLFIIRVDQEKINPLFLKLFLEGNDGRAQLRANSTGTTIPGITARAFEDIVVPTFPREAQESIVSEYEKLLETIESSKRRIERARQKITELVFAEEVSPYDA